MENESLLQDWLIHRFIARPDAFAMQADDGKWSPARRETEDVDYREWPLISWSREALTAHLSGDFTLGHYMLSTESTVKLIAFDIDWKDSGFRPASYDNEGCVLDYEMDSLRDLWHDRSSIHRSWMKTQLRMLSHKLASAMFAELEIPVAVAYSGNKGIHVYGFTGELAASEARMAADMVIKAVNTESSTGTNFELTRGSFEWADKNENLDFSYGNMTVEVFPKQDEVASDSFGNLMALPLGRNKKNPDDPKFFVDMRSPMNELVPADPIWALSTPNPWEDNNA